MANLIHSLNNELPQELHFDEYAQHILENSRTPDLAATTTIALASPPSITANYDSSLTDSTTHQITTSEFLQKLGATFINSIQLQSLPKTDALVTSIATGSISSSPSSSVNDMDIEFGPHHLIMDSQNYNTAMDELQKQLDYDKLMNEVWIGVVLTLILISMIFCFCSCFLYHQFRMWKRNYRTTVTQSSDVEAVKLNMDLEDPVPEYTLVSGLPSYEAALELLHKNPQSCLLVPPSVFEVFNKSENASTAEATATTEASLPLLNDTTNNLNGKNLPTYSELTSNLTHTNASLPYNHSLVSLLSLATQKSSQCKVKSNASSPAASEAERQFKA